MLSAQGVWMRLRTVVFDENLNEKEKDRKFCVPREAKFLESHFEVSHRRVRREGKGDVHTSRLEHTERS